MFCQGPEGFYKGHDSFDGTAEGKQIWGTYGLATHCWRAYMMEVHVGQGIRTYLQHTRPEEILFFSYQNAQILTIHGLKGFLGP